MSMPVKARPFLAGLAALSLLVGAASSLLAQEFVTVSAQLRRSSPRGKEDSGKQAPPSAAIWLTPLNPAGTPTPLPGSAYKLVQRNKQFSPHLLVVPIGSVVQFPNADPFFHNVFSLFDGRRFDLGLYEAGTSRTVTFGREGVSYIFCNIHPEMSAVVIALATRFYAVEDLREHFRMLAVPPGDYTLHIWVQGEDQAALDALTHKVHISADHADLGAITLPEERHPVVSHPDKYGQPYDAHEPPIY
jgi:plastocyanin